MYRHRRAANLYGQSDDEMTGVRISIPLSRIQEHSTRLHLSFIRLLTVQVSRLAPRIINSAGLPVPVGGDANGDDNDNAIHSSDDSDDDDELDDSSPNSSGDLFRDSVDGRTVEFGVVQRHDAWDNLGELVRAAKEREANATIRLLARTFVDFGALTFTEQQSGSLDGISGKEMSIRRHLSLGAESEIWCTSHFKLNLIKSDF